MKNTDFKIYLAGAMEAYDGTEKAKIWRKQVERYFDKYHYGVRVINPTDFYDYGSNIDKNDCEIFRFDLYNLKTSNLVLVNLDCIRKSVGTCIEIYEAYRSGIPVIAFLNEEDAYVMNREDLRNKIHTWIYECCTRIETGETALSRALTHISDYYLPFCKR